ncbi:DNA uptake porin HofQ [Pluralibacter gergoviae]|uniref:DNA uptake porin HofQ n=1 Tax=Pluralibacter gergoviae TaxID=61647 RepID=UPI0028824612|nr:DNA uptake porin HofQ [Pluralibacter gergoviae]ELK5592332.1 DNA uptake porin HofQ [Pluralibacter gergoviae]MDU4431316.1 DNA uptake porin HofQ [Pluralibacter gergoviae]
MRRTALLAAMLFCSGTIAKETPVNLAVDDVPVAQILQALADMARQNIIIAPEVKGNISLQLHELAWGRALRAVLTGAGLAQEKQDGVIYISSGSSAAQKLARQEAERQKKRQARPLKTQSVDLHHAEAAELAKAGDRLLGPRGTLTADRRTNRLLIRDDPEHLPGLLAWVAEMDLPVGQVALSAFIVTINEKSLRELGVKWALAEGPSGRGQPGNLRSDLAVAGATAQAGFNIGRIGGRLLELELSALERRQQLEIIASPRLIASHLQPASIKQGSEIPYQVSSGESGATSVQFKEAVLGMEVTPTVLPRGRVRLKLRITEDMPGQVLQQAGGEVLAIDKQEIETQVELNSGETLALGGIFSQKRKLADGSVPLLSEIPLLGRLFRHSGKANERRELVVFITPRIIPAG